MLYNINCSIGYLDEISIWPLTYNLIVPASIKNKNSEKQIVVRGSKVVIMCQSVGKPLPEVTWFYNDTEIYDGFNNNIHITVRWNNVTNPHIKIIVFFTSNIRLSMPCFQKKNEFYYKS